MGDESTHPEATQGKGPLAASDVLPLVYDELRRLAAHKLSNEAPGQTLQPTALVHEAWLRLSRSADQNWQNRTHFFRTAAECMRRILIDNARRKQQIRHGGSQQRVVLEGFELPDDFDHGRLLEVNEALDRLAALDSA